ncbi:MAG TPA: hypothetical protein VEW42_05715 [Candidatus Eisenbacteria bacterium]|nr:hypothetical protein [Candidatus Eisenbacteria bacterium]
MITFIGISQKDSEVILYYLQKEGDNTFFKAVGSENGFEFTPENGSSYVFAFDEKQKEEQKFNWNSFRVAKQKYEYLLTYKRQSEKNGLLFGALSNDLVVWNEIGKINTITETAAIIPEYQHNEKYVMYTGEKDIRIAYSEDLTHWDLQNDVLLAPRKDFFDDSDLEVANAYEIHNNILLIYYVKKQKEGKTHFLVGAAYFDKNNPSQLLWRSDEPLYESSKELDEDAAYPLGSAIVKKQLILYWKVKENTLFCLSCPIPVITEVAKKKVFNFLVKKSQNNPIITPRPHVPWESRATFNTAAIYEDGKVHFLYRALGDTDLSVLGYATSKDGITIDERSDVPAYIPREPFETPGNHAFSSIAQHFMSGGGYGGIEDPRITRVEDRVYLTYVAFDGATPPRAAMSSIHIDDFLKQDWEKWDKAKLISAPGMVNKSAVVLPRRVRGKYVVMHRIYPNILVDYVDDLEFNNYLQGQYFIPPRKNFWDSKKVGAGAPPIETKDGWLLIYQSVGYQDSSRYKIGAMMLDINHPEKVLYRTHMPIIEPVESYENDGFKAGVVYPCGAVIMKDTLHIYYGGADTVVCAATADVNTFLREMKQNREPKLHFMQSPNFN